MRTRSTLLYTLHKEKKKLRYTFNNNSNKMIHINFIGRLGADAELKTLPNGSSLLSMNVATDEFSHGQKVTVWLRVVTANERMFKLKDYLTKGKMLNINGIETVSVYQTKNGTYAASREVTADRIEFVSSGTQTTTTTQASTEPQQQQATAEKVVEQASEVVEDDLPF